MRNVGKFSRIETYRQNEEKFQKYGQGQAHGGRNERRLRLRQEFYGDFSRSLPTSHHAGSRDASASLCRQAFGLICAVAVLSSGTGVAGVGVPESRFREHPNPTDHLQRNGVNVNSVPTPSFAPNNSHVAPAVISHVISPASPSPPTNGTFGYGMCPLPLDADGVQIASEAPEAKAVKEHQTCFEQFRLKRGSEYNRCGRVAEAEDHVRREYSSCLQSGFQLLDENKVEDFEKAYKNVESIGGGGEHAVYRANLMDSRPGLKIGDVIALRHKPYKSRTDLAYNNAVQVYTRLSVLKNSPSGPITDLYPEIYGFRLGPIPPGINLPEGWKGFYTEMEYIEKYFANEYKDRKVPDSVAFELILGDWATRKIARVEINDNKWRHYGLKKDLSYRAYHLGEDVYLIPPGDMPKRFDLDIWEEYTEKSPYTGAGGILRGEDCVSSNALHAIDEIGKKGIGQVFREYFSQFRLSGYVPKSRSRGKPVRHYFVPDEFLE